MKIPQKTLECKLFKDGYNHVIGVDEVGMGALAGPVVVCAALFNSKFYATRHKKLQWIRDSKLLLPHQREKYARELLRVKSLKFQVCSASPAIIDKLNIYQAARQAMRRAIAKLKVESKELKAVVLIDGNTKIKDLDTSQMAIVKGDQKVFAIACASVIAKVYRDRLMVRLARQYPEYDLEQHKGYGTKLHCQRIKEHGPSPCHRQSFRVK